MGRIILASRKRAKKPYIFALTGTAIYTIEELSYFLFNYYEVVIDEFPNHNLLEWLKEDLGKVRLYDFIVKKEEESVPVKEMYIEFLKESSLYDSSELDVLNISLTAWAKELPDEKMKRKGDIALQFRRYKEARRCYSKLQLENRPDTLHNLGVIEMNLAQYKKGIEDFKSAYKLSGNIDSLVQYLLALKIDKQQELLYEELQKYCEKYSEAKLWHICGLYYEELGQIDNAVKAYTKALDIRKKGFTETYEPMTKILCAKGQYTEARELVIQIEHEDSVQYAICMSIIYESMLESDKALDILNQVEVDEAMKDKVYRRLSEVLVKYGDLDKALAALLRAKNILGEDAVIDYRIAELNKKQGNMQEYFKTIDGLIEQWKGNYRKQIS